jgi:hypothetical protein
MLEEGEKDKYSLAATEWILDSMFMNGAFGSPGISPKRTPSTKQGSDSAPISRRQAPYEQENAGCHAMKTIILKRMEVEMIATTRFIFGAGCALLLAHRFVQETRQVLGWILTSVGVITTFPLVWLVYGQKVGAYD